jgi:anthranilate synthase component I
MLSLKQWGADLIVRIELIFLLDFTIRALVFKHGKRGGDLNMVSTVSLTERKIQTSCQPSELIKALGMEQQSNMCILESAEVGKNESQSSIVGLSSALKVTGYRESVQITALNKNGTAFLNVLSDYFEVSVFDSSLVISIASNQLKGGDFKDVGAMAIVRLLMAQIQYENLRDAEDLFLVGCFSYDMVELVENIVEPKERSNKPLFECLLLDQIVVIDHKKSTTRMIDISFFQSGNHRYVDFSQIENAVYTAQKSASQLVAKQNENTLKFADSCQLSDIEVNLSDEEFAQIVIQCQQHIAQGDVFQIVPSRKFSMPCHQPISAYNVLKRLNPGPYMYYLKFDERVVFGSSPESAISYDCKSNEVGVMPIAGTRSRQFDSLGHIDQEQDTRAEIDLRLDQKELAEHLMLVDLARNDVAKICKTGTRYVSELMTMTKYSRVMHLVSRVVGQLKPELDALDAYMGTLNMGTLVGAPKIEATKLLRQFEPQKRGAYGGAIGYLRGDGQLDTAIVIRTAVVEGGVAQVQAGAGVVRDSISDLEVKETLAKASAVLLAIHESNQLAKQVNEPGRARSEGVESQLYAESNQGGSRQELEKQGVQK